VRRVVEIRDGRLALRAYVPSETVETVRLACQAAALSAIDTQATVEAATLAVALREHARGEVPRSSDPMPGVPGVVDFNQEVDFLSRVARAYASSPVVRAARRGWQAGSDRAERATA
jgi:hypothetical protein